MKKTSSAKFMGFVAVLGLAMLYNTVSVYGQKSNKRNGKNIPEATLSEAKVVASLSTNVFEVQPLKIRLYLLNPSAKRATIGIRNYQNDLVFFDSFFSREYLRHLDLSTMVPGDYKLRIDNKKQHLVRPFSIQESITRRIELNQTDAANQSNFIASIHQSEPVKLRIHLNNVKGNGVEILLRNEADEIVYQNFDSGKQVSKLLDMTALSDGRYTLQIKNADEKVSRTFKITSAKERSFAWLDKAGKPLKQDKMTAFVK